MDTTVNKEEKNFNTQPSKEDTSVSISPPNIVLINIANLVPFKNHPFKLYEGQIFADMVESVRANGILNPIIVRPQLKIRGTYEILAGHNRVEAAKAVGNKEIPAICIDGLTDEEALLIVTETNLRQRSFSDLAPSERAAALAVHYEAMKKKPAYRPHLIDEINQMTGAPVEHGQKTRDKLGKEYELSSTSIARYLHINNLIPALKKRIDKKEIGMRVADSLSFLKPKEQELIETLLSEGKKIDMKHAESLRKEASEKELTIAIIREILSQNQPSAKNVKPVKLSTTFLSKYFKPEQKLDEIEKIISAALEMYFSTEKNM